MQVCEYGMRSVPDRQLPTARRRILLVDMLVALARLPHIIIN